MSRVKHPMSRPSQNVKTQPAYLYEDARVGQADAGAEAAAPTASPAAAAPAERGEKPKYDDSSSLTMPIMIGIIFDRLYLDVG